MNYLTKKGHYHFLEDYGFTQETKTCIGEPCDYEAVINNGTYTLWIGVDIEHLVAHFYLEYDCGGEVERFDEDLSDVAVDDEDCLIPFLDNIVTTTFRRHE